MIYGGIVATILAIISIIALIKIQENKDSSKSLKWLYFWYFLFGLQVLIGIDYIILRGLGRIIPNVLWSLLIFISIRKVYKWLIGKNRIVV